MPYRRRRYPSYYQPEHPVASFLHPIAQAIWHLRAQKDAEKEAMKEKLMAQAQMVMQRPGMVDPEMAASIMQQAGVPAGVDFFKKFRERQRQERAYENISRMLETAQKKMGLIKSRKEIRALGTIGQKEQAEIDKTKAMQKYYEARARAEREGEKPSELEMLKDAMGITRSAYSKRKEVTMMPDGTMTFTEGLPTQEMMSTADSLVQGEKKRLGIKSKGKGTIDERLEELFKKK
jgi:hypothetical protein